MSTDRRAPQGAVETEQEKRYREQQALLEQRVSAMRHQLLVLSGKGGVGKSTCAVSLANGLADRGMTVGLLDADLHGPTVPLMTGVADERPLGGATGLLPIAARKNLFVMSMAFLLPNHTDPVIWRGPLRANALRQFVSDVEWGPLDCLIVDLPPGTGDEPLTVAQAFPDSDGAIVITTPQEASLAACRKAISFVRAVGTPCLGVIENMSGFVCPHCGETTDIFGHGGGEAMAAEMSVPFLGRVPLMPEIVELSDRGESIVDKRAAEPARAAWAGIIDALVARLGIAPVRP
jgi:ATP-binding protein involved in chromosome partitioning